MRRRRIRISRLILVAALLLIGWIILREGIPPARFSPVPLLTLDRPPGFLVDLQLAGLKRDPEACRRVLREPWISASPLPPDPVRDGCGLPNGVRVSQAGGARISIGRVSCETAAALALWIGHGVQPAAVEHLGHRVASVRHYGTYACRGIRSGNPLLKDFKSEHATANAIDIAAFTLTNGQTISVSRNWKGDSREARFMRAAHASACGVFRVTLGPDANALHQDHFHLDRGWLIRCK
ncbi:MAG: extensin family protein [Hyphomicrobiaceae bacterium]